MLGRSKLTTFSAYAAIITSTVIWGATGVIGKEASQEIPVFTMLFLRCCLAGLAISPLFLFDHNRIRLSWRELGQLLGVGTLGMTGSIGLFFYGLQTSSILDMSVITALSPLLISAASWFFLKERLSRIQVLGFAIATFGALLALAQGTKTGQLVGDLFILASSLSMVAFTILSKHLSNRYPPVVLVATSCLAAILGFAPFAAWESMHTLSWISTVTAGAWWQVVYLGVCSSVIAYLGFEWSLRRLSASKVAAISYYQPLISIFLAVTCLQEHINTRYMAGGFIVVIGVYFALRQPHLRHTPAHHHLAARPTHRS